VSDPAGEPADPEPMRISSRSEIGRMRAVVSSSHRTGRLLRLVGELGLESHRHVGSVGIKICTIAAGEAELYVNLALGKSKEWDTCAPHLVLAEAGGMLTDLAGEPISYNRPDVRHHGGLLASNGRAHKELVARIRRFQEQTG
jgi:3'-phosphoadenosine 5'-phosphosulfate (PAPS) 3'-phosphatase